MTECEGRSTGDSHANIRIASILFTATMTIASAADYPDHPVRLIVPQAPGVLPITRPGFSEQC
jgi:hypothetical protein